MIVNILFAVGRMGARNLPDDVITIQRALNNVNAFSGGPTPSLVVDSLCGPKTINAIQKFQLHHFGWSGADGRVDPNGQTHRKLNEIHGPGPWIFPHTKALQLHTPMLCPHGGKVACVPVGDHSVMLASDTFIISGCHHHLGLAGPSPCVTVRWVWVSSVKDDPVLTRNSRGICLSAEQVPQGPVIILG